MVVAQKLLYCYNAVEDRNFMAMLDSQHTSLLSTVAEKPQGPVGNWHSQLYGLERGGGIFLLDKNTLVRGLPQSTIVAVP